MKITFLELRRNPAKLLKAVEQRDEVTISHRGRPVAKLVPLAAAPEISAADHPAFGMWADREDLQDPAESVRQLRRNRFHDL